MQQISRRKILQLGLLAAGGVMTSGLTSCKNKKKDQPAIVEKKKQPAKEKKVWDNNTLYVNGKTKTIHYPDVYRSSEILDTKHFTKAPVSDWERLLNEGNHFLKERSAIIFETLALKSLSTVDDASLNRSTEILQKSFSDIYCKQNRFSWRTYELLLQFISLNNSIPAANKWQTFSAAVKCVDFQRMKMPKRIMWVKDEQAFNQHVKYITDKRAEYLQRINKRINGRI